MGRTKHLKIAEAQNMPNILDYKLCDCKAKIAEFNLPGDNLSLELACGDGKYAQTMAGLYPHKKFIGVDIQGERLWMGAKAAQNQKNMIFLRAPIERLTDYFSEHSVDEIWLTFADPYPRKKQIGKRLTNSSFLSNYKKILKPGGILHFKTDNDGLFDYSVEEIGRFGGNIHVCLHNIDAYITKYPLLSIQTYFETKARKQGKTIHYLNCTLN